LPLPVAECLCARLAIAHARGFHVSKRCVRRFPRHRPRARYRYENTHATPAHFLWPYAGFAAALAAIQDRTEHPAGRARAGSGSTKARFAKTVNYQSSQKSLLRNFANAELARLQRGKPEV